MLKLTIDLLRASVQSLMILLEGDFGGFERLFLLGLILFVAIGILLLTLIWFICSTMLLRWHSNTCNLMLYLQIDKQSNQHLD